MSQDAGSMQRLCADLRAECAELDELVSGLDPDSGWTLRTRFHDWSVRDEIAHLHLFDEFALLAAGDGDAFVRERAALVSEMDRGAQISAIARTRYAGLPGGAIARPWRAGWQALAAALQALDPKARLPWFGPDMSARSFATARIMETWAHGQDIWDALGRRRPASPRLAHIAQLGALTFNWSFVNRGMTPPAAAPRIELLGPEGESWTWGADHPGQGFVRGSALDFCLVVTQRRHYLDTTLELAGTVASQWLEIAQCFAGPPASGPPPGSFPR